MKIGNAFGFWFWTIAVLCIGAGFTFQATQGLRWESDVLKLLPVTEQDPVVEEAMDTFTRRIGKKNIFLVGHTVPEVARAAAQSFAKSLQQSDAFENVVFDTSALGDVAFFDLYFPYRYGLLSEETRALLQKEGGGAQFTRRATETLYSPMSAAVSSYLEDDPLLLFSEYIKAFPKPPSRLEIEEGLLLVRAEDAHYYLMTADLRGSAFAAEVQEKALGDLDAMAQGMRAEVPDSRLITTGVIHFAHAGTQSAKREISTIGVGSIAGIILLLLLVFRSFRPLLLSLLPIGIGCLTALCFCFWWFGELHLLTLVFGASLIGVCIDYSFHFFCECYFAAGTWRPKLALKHIFPGIAMGALTSTLAYLGLLLAPFPGLKQMAVFSAMGLLGAFATVIFWFPLLASLGNPQKRVQRPAFFQVVQGYIERWRRTKLLTVAGLLLLPLLAAGWLLLGLQPKDDIRLLQSQPKDLVRQEQQVRHWIGGVDTSRFLLVEGRDVEALLQNSASIHQALLEAKSKGQLGFFEGIHQWVPSQARQLENRRLLREGLVESGALEKYMETLGFEAPVKAQAVAALENRQPEMLDLQTWLASDASKPFRHLWLGETTRGVAAMMLLGDVSDEAALERLAASHDHVTYIDKVSDVSRLFARYRVLASKLVLLAYAIILLLLFLRYGIAKGIRIILPPLLAATMALALVAALGVTVNLFSMLALLLVLGIGIDYTIFLAESGGTTTMLAIVLSSMTTMLSFGLLALSATPVLQSFGLTLLLGIALAMLLAPLVVAGKQVEAES